MNGIGKPNSKISKNWRGWNITSEKTEHLNGGGLYQHNRTYRLVNNCSLAFLY